MKENPMTTDIQKLDPDAAIDLAYDIFLEMAGENLDPADIMLFNLQFEDHGAVVLIDPDAFAEVWVGLVNEKDEMDDVFAKFLISHREEDREFHVIWKK